MPYLYSIYDSKAQVFRVPFTAGNKEVALRMLHQAATGGESDLSRYPDDFGLVLIGKFDEISGEVEGCAHQSYGLVAQIIGAFDNEQAEQK